MKRTKYALIGLMLMVFISSVSAYDTLLGNEVAAGWNWPSSSWVDTSLGYIGLDYNNDYIYFQFEYAGNTSVEFNLYAYTTPAELHAFYCDSLNYSVSTETWTRIRYIYFNNSINNTPVFEGDSNVGIWRCFYNSAPSQGNILISTTVSEVTYLIKDYSQRSFVAGTLKTIPLVNKYYPQTTIIHTSGYSDYTQYNNASGLYFERFAPSCSAATSSSQAITVHNFNSSATSNYQITTLYANITAITDLNITATVPTNNVNYSYPATTQANFSISTNNPGAITNIIWYIDDSQQSNADGNFSASFSLASRQQPYTVKAQIEDTNCMRFPTAQWNITVGNTITFSGTVYSSTGGRISGAAIFLIGGSGFIPIVETDSLGNFEITGLSAGTYIISASADGFITQSINKTMTYSSVYNPTVYADGIFTLTPFIDSGSVTINAYDVDTLSPLTTYNLSFYYAGMEVLRIVNGVKVFNLSGQYYTPTATGNPTTITNNPLGYTYTVTITKSGYSYSGSSLYPYTASYVQTVSPETINLYLKQNLALPNASANFSNVAPNADTINLSVSASTTINATIITSNDLFTICYYLRPSYSNYVKTCLPDTYTGINGSIQIPINNLISGITYYFEITATTGNSVFSSGEYSFNTVNGQTITTTTIVFPTTSSTFTPIPVTTSSTTTTSTTTTSSTTTLPVWVGNLTEKTYDCTNLTGKIMEADYFHASICAYVLPLGVDWTYGLTLIALCVFTYLALDTLISSAIVGLLFTGVFYEYLPQPTVGMLGLGLAFVIGLILFGLYQENRPSEDLDELRKRYGQK